MITTFKNLTDFHKYFHSEQVCREFLEKARWGDNPVCPHCGTASKPYKIKDGNRYKCSDKDCKKKFSAISGTNRNGKRNPKNPDYFLLPLCA